MDQQQQFSVQQADSPANQNEGQFGAASFGPPGTQGWASDEFMGKELHKIYFVYESAWGIWGT